MPTCRCIKFHVASSDILKENESEHWLAKKKKRERDYKAKGEKERRSGKKKEEGK